MGPQRAASPSASAKPGRPGIPIWPAAGARNRAADRVVSRDLRRQRPGRADGGRGRAARAARDADRPQPGGGRRDHRRGRAGGAQGRGGRAVPPPAAGADQAQAHRVRPVRPGLHLLQRLRRPRLPRRERDAQLPRLRRAPAAASPARCASTASRRTGAAADEPRPRERDPGARLVEFEGGRLGVFHWTNVGYDSPLRWWRSSRFLAEKGMGITVGRRARCARSA